MICGAVGKLNASVAEGSGLTCDWEAPAHFRYSAAGMKEHALRLESIKADFMARRYELAELRKPYKGD